MKKKKNVKETDPWEYGDKFCFTAMDPDTKLVPCFTLGDRDTETVQDFMFDLSERMKDTIQLSSDAYSPFLECVQNAFGENVQYGQVMKSFRAVRPDRARYSPPRIVQTWSEALIGRPNRRHISTSLIERQNLTVRMQLRRFTRLTNAFSKKFRNLKASLSLFYSHYNFCRIHGAIKKTPAMAAGLTDHPWTIAELLTEAATLC